MARAIRFIYQHSGELEVDTSAYSLWGGSAGARMAALVGASDGIANYQTMQNRIERIRAQGTDAVIWD